MEIGPYLRVPIKKICHECKTEGNSVNSQEDSKCLHKCSTKKNVS